MTNTFGIYMDNIETLVPGSGPYCSITGEKSEVSSGHGRIVDDRTKMFLPNGQKFKIYQNLMMEPVDIFLDHSFGPKPSKSKKEGPVYTTLTSQLLHTTRFHLYDAVVGLPRLRRRPTCARLVTSIAPEVMPWGSRESDSLGAHIEKK